MRISVRWLIATTFTACLLSVHAVQAQSTVPAGLESMPSDSAANTLEDAAIPAHQRALLEMAFDVACAIPIKPHVKDRCKLQEEVVAACLQLRQARLALTFAQHIDDWRRGAALADLALYCAKNDRASEVDGFLQQARSIAAGADDWRRDLIRSKIARVHVWMGQETRAAQFTSELGKPEQAVVESAIAERASADQFDARMDSLIASLDSGDFDLMRGALDSCVVLYGRNFDDTTRRERLETVIRLYAERMPVTIRIDLLLQMARHAIERGNALHGRTLTSQASGYLHINGWQAEYRVPYLGRVAAVQALAGDAPAAEGGLNEAIAMYMTDRDTIITVERCRALLPVAEAYRAMDRADAAQSIYRRALEEAGANPNARPRANDLGAACLSLATHDIVPDENLWQLLRELRAGLANPW